MKHQICTVALLCAAFSTAPGQVASHTPTPMKALAEAKAPNLTGEAAGSGVQVTGKPVVRINGAVLTDRDLLREMYAIFPYARVHNGFPKSQEAEIRRGALQMIEYEELVYQEAERRKMTISAARLNQAEAEFRSRFPGDDEFREYLKLECNGSRQTLRQRVRRSLLIEALLKAEVSDKSKVSLAEARAYYGKNPTLFQRGELFGFQTISVMPPENSSAEVKQQAHKRAEDVLRQAKATKSFEEFGLLAEKLSEDDFRVNMGDHKLVAGETLPAELVEPARAMQPGEVSDLLQFGSFYTIVRLNAHVPAGKVQFEEVKDRLLSDLQKTKYDRLRENLDRKLRLTATVVELKGVEGE